MYIVEFDGKAHLAGVRPGRRHTACRVPLPETTDPRDDEVVPRLDTRCEECTEAIADLAWRGLL